MNLSEIKSSLGVQTLNLNYVTTEAGERTAWLKHWDNDNRIAILLHSDTLSSIKTSNDLGISTQVKQGAKGEYVAKTICIYKPADVVL